MEKAIYKAKNLKNRAFFDNITKQSCVVIGVRKGVVVVKYADGSTEKMLENRFFANFTQQTEAKEKKQHIKTPKNLPKEYWKKINQVSLSQYKGNVIRFAELTKNTYSVSFDGNHCGQIYIGKKFCWLKYFVRIPNPLLEKFREKSNKKTLELKYKFDSTDKDTMYYFVMSFNELLYCYNERINQA